MRKGVVDSKISIARLDGWLEETDGLPLFLWLHIFDAHEPYVVPDDLRWLYNQALCLAFCHRIVEAYPLNEATIATGIAIRHGDVVERILLGSVTGETNCDHRML